MEFSDRFVYEMTRPFYAAQSINLDTSLESSLTLDSNNVFSRSLIVDITGDDIEIPSIVRVPCENSISNNLVYSFIQKTERIILPLYTNSNDLNKRTFDSIIKEFFCQVSFNKRLLKVTTAKGETYYGGCGLILDEKFNPLLMCGLKARKVVTKNDRDIEVVSMQYYRAICHVSPVVFAEPNRLINKGIINKLIPLYTTEDIRFPTSNFRISNSPNSMKVEVVIDDFSKFFITPIAPTPSKCSNDTLNKCLNDNIEDILCLL